MTLSVRAGNPDIKRSNRASGGEDPDEGLADVLNNPERVLRNSWLEKPAANLRRKVCSIAIQFTRG